MEEKEPASFGDFGIPALSGGAHVIIRKLRPTEHPRFQTPGAEDYVPGEVNWNKSVPVDYEVEGILEEDVRWMRPLKMIRLRRNDVVALGHWTTSPIQSYSEKAGCVLLHTVNSVYQLTPVD